METGHFRAKHVTCQSQQSIRIKLDGPKGLYSKMNVLESKDGRFKKLDGLKTGRSENWTVLRKWTYSIFDRSLWRFFGHSLFTNRTVHFKSTGRPFWQMTFVFMRPSQVWNWPSDLIQDRLFLNRWSSLSRMTAHFDKPYYDRPHLLSTNQMPFTTSTVHDRSPWYQWPWLKTVFFWMDRPLSRRFPSTFTSLFVHFFV